jgi:Zn-dependent protease with chaperone function
MAHTVLSALHRLGELGTLRLLLLGLALFALALIPPAGTAVGYSGWQLLSTVVAPVLAPILVMVLLLDVLMARIFMSDAPAAERGRMKLAIALHLLVVALLLLRWLPYFLALRS